MFIRKRRDLAAFEVARPCRAAVAALITKKESMTNLRHSFSLIRGMAAVRPVNRRVALLATLVAVVILALNLYAPASPTPWQRLLAGLLIALCALPTLMWASDRQWHHSLMPYYGFLYALYFGAPIFLRRDFFGEWLNGLRIDDSLIDTALLLALTGWLLLLAGYFGPFHGWLARKLPRINVLPGESRRYAMVMAVILAVIGVPFFYLDNVAVVAFYAGKELLPPAIAFSVVLAGQFTVLSILILFHLQLRRELGRAGKSLLWGLVAYYTLFGMATGMANHALKAILALFMASAIALRNPTWRLVGCGVLTAAILIFVVLPTREEFRALIWTHGVQAGDVLSWRPSTNEFSLREARMKAGAPIVETPDYDLTFRDGTLRYFYKGPGNCSAPPVGRGELAFFLHLIPVDVRSLPDRRIEYGYDNLDFSLESGQALADGGCVYEVRLPAYAIERVRTGLFTRASRTSRYHPLTTHVAWEGFRAIGKDGEWQLRTRDASTWEIGPSDSGTRRLLVAEADEPQRMELAGMQAGNTILVLADEDNWAEYLVSAAWVMGLRVHIRLGDLLDSAGDRSSLVDGASATLYYVSGGAGDPAVHAYNETHWSKGRNPWAPHVDTSLAQKAALYLGTISGFVGTGDVFDRALRSVDSSAARLDMLLPLAWVVRQTPEMVPYLHGETYYPILFKLIPRAVFKDKPKDVKDLGQRFGFLPEGNEVNAFKVHQLGELYANFGTLGIVMGMFVFGVLYRVLYQLFFHAAASVVTLAAGGHILTVLLIEMESMTTVSWGFVVWYAVLLALLNTCARIGRWRRTEGSE